MRKKHLPFLLPAAALLLLALLFFTLTHTPKAEVLSALEHTYGKEASGASLAEWADCFQSPDRLRTFTLTLTSLQPSRQTTDMLDPVLPDFLTDHLSLLEGLGFQIRYRMDQNAQEMAASCTVSYLVKPYLHLECRAVNSRLSFCIPELSSAWLTFSTDSFGADYNNSLLAGLTGFVLPDDLAFGLFPEKSSPFFPKQTDHALSFRELLRDSEVTRLDQTTYEIRFPASKKEAPLTSLLARDTLYLTMAPDHTVSVLSGQLLLPQHLSSSLPSSADFTLTASDEKEGFCLQLIPADTDARLTLCFEPDVLDQSFSFRFSELTLTTSYGTASFSGSLSLEPADDSIYLPSESPSPGLTPQP